MNEFVNWIDERIEKVILEPSYNLYFSETSLVQDDNVFYLSNINKGIELVLNADKYVQSIHFFGEKNKEFEGELPFKVKFNFTRSKILERFGKPFRSGGGHNNIYIGYVKSWDKYLTGNCSIRFEYDEYDKHIFLVTVASLKLESYFDSKLQ
ncbi:MAG: hypothetical protein ACTHML_05810 [Ginsengibacter sp.]